MDTQSKHDGQMPEHPGENDQSTPGGEQPNPPIQPTDEPWTKQ